MSIVIKKSRTKRNNLLRTAQNGGRNVTVARFSPFPKFDVATALKNQTVVPLSNADDLIHRCNEVLKMIDDDPHEESIAAVQRARDGIRFFQKIGNWPQHLPNSERPSDGVGFSEETASDVTPGTAFEMLRGDLLFPTGRDLHLGMLMLGKHEPLAYGTFAERCSEDLRYLAEAVEQSTEAAMALTNIAITATAVLNKVAEQKPESFKKALWQFDQWPVIWASHPRLRSNVLGDNPTKLKELINRDLGKNHPFRCEKSSREGRGDDWERVCVYLWKFIEEQRQKLRSPPFSRLSPLPAWARGIRGLDDFTDKSFPAWFRVIRRILNDHKSETESIVERLIVHRSSPRSKVRKRFMEKLRRRFRAMAPKS